MIAVQRLAAVSHPRRPGPGRQGQGAARGRFRVRAADRGLEVAWVLRSTYRFSRGAVAAALTRLLGLPGVVVEDGATVARALVWFGRGLEFADALHLASSGQARAFATFNRALQRAAGRIDDAIPVIAP